MNTIIFQLFGHIDWAVKNPRILEIIFQGKGVNPYEIIVDMESFLLNQIKIFGKKQNSLVN